MDGKKSRDLLVVRRRRVRLRSSDGEREGEWRRSRRTRLLLVRVDDGGERWPVRPEWTCWTGGRGGELCLSECAERSRDGRGGVRSGGSDGEVRRLLVARCARV